LNTAPALQVYGQVSSSCRSINLNIDPNVMLGSPILLTVKINCHSYISSYIVFIFNYITMVVRIAYL